MEASDLGTPSRRITILLFAVVHWLPRWQDRCCRASLELCLDYLSTCWSLTGEKDSIWIAGGGLGGWTHPTVFSTPLAHCQIMYTGGVSYILYTYDLRHKFGQSPTIEKFNPPVYFSQFKHWRRKEYFTSPERITMVKRDVLFCSWQFCVN